MREIGPFWTVKHPAVALFRPHANNLPHFICGYGGIMRRLKRIAVWGSFAVLGAVAGAGGTAYGYQRYLVRASSDSASQQAGMTAIALSSLRLGDNAGAIKDLEGQLDGSLAAVRSWEQIGCQPSTQAIHWLAGAKVYRIAYPSTNARDTGIGSLLQEIPMPDSNTCDGSICQLQRKMAQPPTKNSN